MCWSEENDVLFLRELLVSSPFKFKAGSHKRDKVWDAVADVLNGIEKPNFKVDHQALWDHLKEYRRKKAYEEKASGIDVDTTETDVLLEEILQLQKESELSLQATSR